MKTDNTIFFVSGLVFGVLIGYFLSESLVPRRGSATAGGAVSREPEAPPRRLPDREEVAALERLAGERPDDAEVRAQLGNLYFEAGQYEQAVRWLREATARKTSDLHLRNHLALALGNLNRVDEAVREYEAALAINPDHPQTLLGLGRIRLYATRDIRGGLAMWEKLARIAPGSPEAESIREELEALKTAHSGND